MEGPTDYGGAEPRAYDKLNPGLCAVGTIRKISYSLLSSNMLNRKFSYRRETAGRGMPVEIFQPLKMLAIRK